MALMTWSSNYSVGLADMDAQHRQWIAILNRLHDAMREGKAREIQGKILQEMVAYAHAHFSNEEFMLRMRSYPSLTAHQQKHVGFSVQVALLQSKMNSGNSLTLELMDLLREWLTNHILVEDKKYGVWMKAA